MIRKHVVAVIAVFTAACGFVYYAASSFKPTGFQQPAANQPGLLIEKAPVQHPAGIETSHPTEKIAAERSASSSDQAWSQAYVIPLTRSDEYEECDVLSVDGRDVCWNQLGYSPYLALGLDGLRQMAVNDPVAADALVLRLPVFSDERRAYAIHASQLSGKPGPIYRYVMMTPLDSDDLEQQLEMYALLLYADTFGPPEPKAEMLEHSLRAGLALSSEELKLEAAGVLDTLLEEAASARDPS